MTFLGLEPPHNDPATSRYAVLPVPYEGTVSYKEGTCAGPEAILDASRQVELFDEELLAEFHEAGVATLPAVESAGDVSEQMRRVRAAAVPAMRDGRFLLTLGGEHSITAPLVEAAVAIHGPLSVLQIDAHADLRDRYGGTRHSHAAVMRRVVETAESVAQVGIRNFSLEEYEQCRSLLAACITPQVIATDPDWIERVLSRLGPKVYVTIDIDGFDPAVAPGTGTPEPGGLTWAQGCALLRRVCRERDVVAADVVEVRPIPPNHVTEFLAARLAYKLIAYTQAR
jgi:agmatinase